MHYKSKINTLQFIGYFIYFVTPLDVESKQVQYQVSSDVVK